MTLSGVKTKKEDSALLLRIIKYNFKENCTHLPFSFAIVQSSDLRHSIPPILCPCLIYLLQTPKTKQLVTCSKLAMFSIRSLKAMVTNLKTMVTRKQSFHVLCFLVIIVLTFTLLPFLWLLTSEAFLGPRQTSMMELSGKIINSFFIN